VQKPPSLRMWRDGESQRITPNTGGRTGEDVAVRREAGDEAGVAVVGEEVVGIQELRQAAEDGGEVGDGC